MEHRVEREGWGAAPFDRRSFLGGALALGALAAGCSSSTSTVARAATTRPAGSDLGAVEHVVFLMQENRSFDHYFGSYKGVRGFDDHPEGHLGAFAQPFPANRTRHPVGTQLPFHLDTASGLGECTYDLTHSWRPQHLCRNGGAMDAFVTTHTSAQYEGPEYGVQTMGYHTRADLPYHYALADAFTLCDAYHCSIMGPTHPNRLMALSGTIDPDGRHGGPVLITNELPEAKFSVDWTTVPELLEDKGVSWKTYSPPGPLYRIDNPNLLLISDAILPYFSQYSDPASPLHQKAFVPTFPDDFTHDVRIRHAALGVVDHPPTGLRRAPAGTAQPGGLVHRPGPPGARSPTPRSGPRRSCSSCTTRTTASSTTWRRRWHPPGTPGEYVTVDPLPATAQGVAGPLGLGFRVPMLVVSPFSRGGYVSSETFDHTSQIRFLEERFGIRASELSAWRRKTVGDLTSTLRLGSADPAPPALPSTARDTRPRWRPWAVTRRTWSRWTPRRRRTRWPRSRPCPARSAAASSGSRSPPA